MACLWRSTCLRYEVELGGNMKNRLTVLALFVSVCGLWGCAKSNEHVAASAPQAVDQRDEPLSALNLPIVESKLPELQIWQATPVPDSVTAEKSKPNEAAAPSLILVKNQTAERKPAEMKVVNAFERDQYLSSRVKTLLPPRSTLSDTAAGFKKEKPFIAAMHLSQNLNIPFDQIKTRMTGEHHVLARRASRPSAGDDQRRGQSRSQHGRKASQRRREFCKGSEESGRSSKARQYSE